MLVYAYIFGNILKIVGICWGVPEGKDWELH